MVHGLFFLSVHTCEVLYNVTCFGMDLTGRGQASSSAALGCASQQEDGHRAHPTR